MSRKIHVDLKRVTKLLASGKLNQAAVAAQLGVSHDVLRARMREAGMTDPRDFVKIDLDLVVKLRDEGKSLKEISRIMGIAYGTLAKRTARAGIQFIRGMTRERWIARRANCSDCWQGRKPDAEIVLQQSLQLEYLDAVVEEETLPHWMRGRAARLKAAMQGKVG